ncbi:MAG: transcription antitermination factor NusB [Chloroflexota bacterium]
MAQPNPAEPGPEDQSADVEAAVDDVARTISSVGPRRHARIIAFKVLYEADVAHHAPQDVLERILEAEAPAPRVRSYARDLVDGVLARRPELDATIMRLAPAWPLRQMAAVERTLLRLGLFECLHMQDRVPLRAAMNEAIELAKLYGSDSTPRFINGVLGNVSPAPASTGGEGPETLEQTTQSQELSHNL